MFVYYTVVLVPGDPLRSYRGNWNSVYVCMYVYYTVQLVSCDPLPKYRGHLN
jgi:hypothetical protein